MQGQIVKVDAPSDNPTLLRDLAVVNASLVSMTLDTWAPPPVYLSYLPVKLYAVRVRASTSARRR